jgi:putative intracellular protease/amidase
LSTRSTNRQLRHPKFIGDSIQFEPYVVTDGLLITGQNPASSGPAAQELIAMVGRADP